MAGRLSAALKLQRHALIFLLAVLLKIGQSTATDTAMPCSLEPLKMVGKGRYVRVRVNASANLIKAGSADTTTCGEFTDGRCSVVVPFPDFPCLVNCISDSRECIEWNARTPGVNPSIDPSLCSGCSISACAACTYESNKTPSCERCFAGFIGSHWSLAGWSACTLWDQGMVVKITGMITVVVTAIVVFTIVATCVATCSMGQLFRKGTEITARAKQEKLLPHQEKATLLTDDALPAPSEPLLDTQDRNRRAILQGLNFSIVSSIKFSNMRSHYQNERKEKANDNDSNRKSTKDNNSSSSNNNNNNISSSASSSTTRGRLRRMMANMVSADMKDMGLGLQLFFNSQIFLIVVSCFAWLFTLVRDHALSSSQSPLSLNNLELHMATLGEECGSLDMDLRDSYLRTSLARTTTAKLHEYGCSIMWICLLILSWLFHAYQRHFAEEYDKMTLSHEDYTIKLENLPTQVTSEKWLKRELEKELRCEGLIHGVCICYDILSSGVGHRIEEMIENIVEHDDLTNGWCPEIFSTSLPELDRRMEQDAKDFKLFLNSDMPKLRGSGTAYVVFKEQTDMVKVANERRGIAMKIFEQAPRPSEAAAASFMPNLTSSIFDCMPMPGPVWSSGGAQEGDAASVGQSLLNNLPSFPLRAPSKLLQGSASKLLRSSSKLLRAPAGIVSSGARLGWRTIDGLFGVVEQGLEVTRLKKPRKRRKDDDIRMVKLKESDDEPQGLRFYDFCLPEHLYKFRRYVAQPSRMLLYIGAYTVVAHLFYWSMIKPFQDSNAMEGAENSLAVKLTGKFVLMVNFGIQTAVMVSVEQGHHMKISRIDRITFIWNTVLLLITNGYVIIQEGYREGIQWRLTPPDPEKEAEQWWHWLRHSFHATRVEKEVGDNLVGIMTDQILMLYVIGEVANVLLPVIFYWLALRCIFVYNIGGSDRSWVQKMLRAMLPAQPSEADNRVITSRAAERAQMLMPLLLWMEYTYIVVFAAMTFVTAYFVTDKEGTISGWLFGFSIIFHIWQRYIMLWLYGKATYDSASSYEAFMKFWGIVLSMLPPASIYWAGRLNEIKERPFVLLVMVLVYMLALGIYSTGIDAIDKYFVQFSGEEVDDFGDGGDPGYQAVMEETQSSWWNMNPIYVLKKRYCPDCPGYEVHDDDVQCWPTMQKTCGYYEPGKEFRHQPQDDWQRENQAWIVQRMMAGILPAASA